MPTAPPARSSSSTKACIFRPSASRFDAGGLFSASEGKISLPNRQTDVAFCRSVQYTEIVCVFSKAARSFPLPISLSRGAPIFFDKEEWEPSADSGALPHNRHHGTNVDLSVPCADRGSADVPSGQGGQPAGRHVLSHRRASAGTVLSGTAGAEPSRLRLRVAGTGGRLRHHHAGGAGLHRLRHRQRIPAQRPEADGPSGPHRWHRAGRHHNGVGGCCPHRAAFHPPSRWAPLQRPRLPPPP